MNNETKLDGTAEGIATRFCVDPYCFGDYCGMKHAPVEPAAPVVRPVEHKHGLHFGYITCSCGWAWNSMNTLTGTMATRHGLRMFEKHKAEAAQPTPVVVSEDRDLTLEEWRDECDKLTELAQKLMNENELLRSTQPVPLPVQEEKQTFEMWWGRMTAICEDHPSPEEEGIARSAWHAAQQTPVEREETR